MCGLVGGWESRPTESFERALDAALHTIRHRGPNDTGKFVQQLGPSELRLGSTRLSILDLSTAGHMPMESSDGQMVVAFNGEITNYVEIRKELTALGHVFRSGTDTEVLLASWQQWGEQSLDRFEGMFAFAMLDKARKRLTLARDCFGIKPLFYSFLQGKFYFASEIQALYPLLRTRLAPDQQTSFNYLHWGYYDSTEDTFIEGVKQLRPGHVVTFDLETGALDEPRRYWWPDVATTHDGTFEDAADAVRDMFSTSVRRNLRSDVPLGIALSGGVDSSAISCMVRHLEPDMDVNTFSFVYPGFEQSEHEWVDLINARIAARGHQVIPGDLDLSSDLDEMILAQGEPFGSTSIYAQFRVFKLAKDNGVTVTLDGQGADEVFAGYDGFPRRRVMSLLDSGRVVESIKFLNEWGTWPGRNSQALTKEIIATYVPHWAKAALRKGAPTQELNDLYADESADPTRVKRGLPFSPAERKRGVNLKTQLREQLMQSGLPSLLRHGDRNSMHFSIESRVPFLDKKLVEFVLSLPENYLLSDRGETKHVLRAALRGIVPDVVLDRRDKVGFATPEAEWIRPYLDREGSALASESGRFGFLNEQAVSSFFTDPNQDLRLQWRLTNLLRWSAISLPGGS